MMKLNRDAPEPYRYRLRPCGLMARYRWMVLIEHYDGTEEVGYGNTIAEAEGDLVVVVMWDGRDPITWGDHSYRKRPAPMSPLDWVEQHSRIIPTAPAEMQPYQTEIMESMLSREKSESMLFLDGCC